MWFYKLYLAPCEVWALHPFIFLLFIYTCHKIQVHNSISATELQQVFGSWVRRLYIALNKEPWIEVFFICCLPPATKGWSIKLNFCKDECLALRRVGLPGGWKCHQGYTLKTHGAIFVVTVIDRNPLAGISPETVREQEPKNVMCPCVCDFICTGMNVPPFT